MAQPGKSEIALLHKTERLQLSQVCKVGMLKGI